MRGWIASDEQGVTYAVRAGSGAVTAVAEGRPIDDGRSETLIVVEIDCTPPGRRPRSLRVTTRGWLDSDDPLVHVARQAEAQGLPVTWLIEWHRLPHVPRELPIENLNIATDTIGRVCTLAVVDVTEAKPAGHAQESESVHEIASRFEAGSVPLDAGPR